MCGGKKEPEKKLEPPGPSSETLLPPAEEAPPTSPPSEEPKGSVSAAESVASESKLVAAQPSIALMTQRKGVVGAGLAKGPVVAESTSGKNISLTLTTQRGPEPKGVTSQTFGKATVSIVKVT